LAVIPGECYGPQICENDYSGVSNQPDDPKNFQTISADQVPNWILFQAGVK
jgi:hypothetical protein